ncbi:unnamed protein product, partial [Protopolystoma xenopodis]
STSNTVGERAFPGGATIGAATGTAATGERRRKESIIDLTRYIDKRVRVKFSGGREASGTLKGCDNLYNMVLDCTIEHLRDPDDPSRLTDDTRELGLVVCRCKHFIGIGFIHELNPLDADLTIRSFDHLGCFTLSEHDPLFVEVHSTVP